MNAVWQAAAESGISVPSIRNETAAPPSCAAAPLAACGGKREYRD